MIKIEINREKKQLDKEQLHKSYKGLFTSKIGEMVLEDLANISGMYRSNFVSDNVHHTSFLEGQRNLFLYICSQIEENEINNIEGEEK